MRGGRRMCIDWVSCSHIQGYRDPPFAGGIMQAWQRTFLQAFGGFRGTCSAFEDGRFHDFHNAELELIPGAAR